MKRNNLTYLVIAVLAILVIGFYTVDLKSREAGIFTLPDFASANEVTPANKAPINTLKDLNSAFVNLVNESVPSVVTLNVTQTVEVQPSPFARFFGGRNMPQERMRRGLGSGVIVSEDGYILTNNHVVEGADEILVTLYNDQEYKGTVVGRDPLTDIAVVKIDAEGLNAIEIGNSKKVQVGELVLAIGSPLNEALAHSVSMGIVSAKGRTIGISRGGYENFIQTDAAINPGNSGGPLINMSGELIGINTAIASTSRESGYQGIGFAVPSNIAKDVMMELINHGEVERARLGISYGGAVDATMAKALGIDNPQGVIVGGVLEDGPAAQAGLKKGDVLQTLNGEPIESWLKFRTAIATSDPGDVITLGLIRDGEQMDIEVTLGKKSPEEMASVSNSEDENIKEKLGFSVENLTDRLAQKLELENGQMGVVVTDINRASDAYRQGLRRGFVITEVDHEPVTNVEEFREAIYNLQEEKEVVLLQVLVAGNSQYIAFEL